jgi:3-hydroxymyristoyl/3-hydroxydecanoyl-(acyl carrier protein) dehydratase
MRTRLKKVSEAGDMIIERFDFEVLAGPDMIYAGETDFGFFTAEALCNQVGIPGASRHSYQPSAAETRRGVRAVFEDVPPLHPGDVAHSPAVGLSMPAKALLMIDAVDLYVPDGGPSKFGFIRGVKNVDPDEWFFKAHFFQDPVCPGSLGVESFLQLVRFVAMDRWKGLADSHRFELLTGLRHNWTYRGQIVPDNQSVTVEAVITGVRETPVPEIRANGYVKVDGLTIYRLENFGYRLVPVG